MVCESARGAPLIRAFPPAKIFPPGERFYANIAVPATIQLVAQTRERLLTSAESFTPSEVAQHRREASEIGRHVRIGVFGLFLSA